MTAAERRKMIKAELGKAIRANGRAHAKVAALCRRPPTGWRLLRALGRAADRAALSDGRVSGFALMLASEERGA